MHDGCAWVVNTRLREAIHTDGCIRCKIHDRKHVYQPYMACPFRMCAWCLKAYEKDAACIETYNMGRVLGTLCLT